MVGQTVEMKNKGAVEKVKKSLVFTIYYLRFIIYDFSKAGIKKCNTFVMDDNVEGRRFWEYMGWYILEDNYRTFQIPTI